MNESYGGSDVCGPWWNSYRALLRTAVQGIEIESVVPVADDDFPKCRNATAFAAAIFNDQISGDSYQMGLHQIGTAMHRLTKHDRNWGSISQTLLNEVVTCSQFGGLNV